MPESLQTVELKEEKAIKSILAQEILESIGVSNIIKIVAGQIVCQEIIDLHKKRRKIVSLGVTT